MSSSVLMMIYSFYYKGEVKDGDLPLEMKLTFQSVDENEPICLWTIFVVTIGVSLSGHLFVYLYRV
jgi:hypothetical protein